MAYDFSKLKQKIKDADEHLRNELSSIRTSRASSAILDKVKVSSYGSLLPLNQLGAITIEDVKTVRFSPWDNSILKDVEKAVLVSDLGVSVAVDDKGVRIIFPDLTSDRRTALIKIAKQKLEESKIALRRLRDDIWTDIQEKEKQGGMSEDEKFRLKNEMQKQIDEANKKFEESFAKKEKEITG